MCVCRQKGTFGYVYDRAYKPYGKELTALLTLTSMLEGTATALPTYTPTATLNVSQLTRVPFVLSCFYYAFRFCHFLDA